MKKNVCLQSMAIDQIGTGRAIRNYRRRAGYSVRDVAQMLVVSEQTVYHWEQGIAIPSIDNLVRLAVLYEISLEDILMLMPQTA